MKFKQGDRVVVVDQGRTYATHSEAAAELGATCWEAREGRLLPNGSFALVINQIDHFVLIERGCNQYVIGEDGIELREGVKSQGCESEDRYTYRGTPFLSDPLEYCIPVRGTSEMLTLEKMEQHYADAVKYSVECDWAYGDGTGSIPRKKKLMTQLSNIAKKLLDADTRVLVEAGYLNSELELTEKGEEKVLELVFFANKDELAKKARQEVAEAKKCSK